MQDQLNTVIRQLFQKDSLRDVSEQTIRDFTEKYPYSPIGQLLLAKKLSQGKTDGFEKQAVKSVLYFNNPLWFDWLISMEHVRDNNNDDAIKDTPSPTDPLIAETIPEDETIQEEKADEEIKDGVVTEEVLIEKEVVDSFDDEVIENTGFIPDQPIPSQVTDIDREKADMVEESVGESESRDESSDELQDHRNEDQPVYQTTTPSQKAIESFDDELIENTGFIEEEVIKDENPEQVSTRPDSTQESDYKTEEQLLHQNNGHDEVQRTPEEEYDDELIENTGFVPEPEEPTQSQLSIKLPSDLIEKGPEVKEADSGKAELSFEPYHTIDYFASQGIKLKQEDLERDKFGKQLKSFTEWLRTMKKIPGSKTQQTLDVEPGDSATIRKKADESIEGKEIETETMAEVWAKQGNISKAINIYEKLSLSNPDKSHYFAAKIEQLKAN